jgi:chromosome segregation ATPase
MTPGKNEIAQDSAQRIYQRLDKFEERIVQLEGQMSVATKWLERIEHRLQRMEEVRAELLQAITKLQTELELNRGTTEKDIILQLLDNDKSDMEKLTELIEGDKGRKQERFLQIWAVLGPVIASVLSAWFTRYFL